VISVVVVILVVLNDDDDDDHDDDDDDDDNNDEVFVFKYCDVNVVNMNMIDLCFYNK